MTVQKQVKAKANTITSRDGSRTITAEEFDRIFDEGSDEIRQFVDLSSFKPVHPKAQRVNVDFPPALLRDLDAVVAARGVTRQALIKMWLADKLDEHRRNTAKAAE
jgi:hypothetical protein